MKYCWQHQWSRPDGWKLKTPWRACRPWWADSSRQCHPFDEPVALVCNDEGKLLGLPLNRCLRLGFHQ